MGHDYSSTHVALPPAAAAAIKKLSASIDDAHLSADGREAEPHITVKYGLHADDVKQVEDVLAGEAPIEATLGNTSLFENEDTHVLKLDVDSPDLVRVNRKLSERLPHTDTHASYTPHATIAYLTPDTKISSAYSGQRVPGVSGRKFHFDRIVFSDKNGRQTEVSLAGKKGGLMPYSRPEETKTLSVDIKSINNDGSFEGYASAYNNEDSDGDVVMPGAFADSLKENNGIVPILWSHNVNEPIGWNLAANEDSKGLHIKGKFTEGDPMAFRIRNWMKLGTEVNGKVGLSIGYNVVDKFFKNGVRYLRKLKLMEYSPVVFPANTQALVSDVKSAGISTMDLAEETRGWDAAAAKGRIWAWAAEGDKIDYAKAEKCFLWHNDQQRETKAAYKLPVADIINGEPRLVLAALSHAAEKLPTSDIPEADKEAVQHTIARCHKKFGKDSPFSQGKSLTVAAEPEPAGEVPTAAVEPIAAQPAGTGVTVKDFNAALNEHQNREEHMKKLRAIKRAHAETMDAIYKSKDMPLNEKKANVEANVALMSKALADWHTKNLDLGYGSDDGMGYMSGDAPTEHKDGQQPVETKNDAAPAAAAPAVEPEETKSGRTISAATKSKLLSIAAKMEDCLAAHAKLADQMKAAHGELKSVDVEAPQGDAPAPTGELTTEGKAAPTEAPETGAPEAGEELTTVKSLFGELGKKFETIQLKAA